MSAESEKMASLEEDLYQSEIARRLALKLGIGAIALFILSRIIPPSFKQKSTESLDHSTQVAKPKGPTFEDFNMDQLQPYKDTPEALLGKNIRLTLEKNARVIRSSDQRGLISQEDELLTDYSIQATTQGKDQRGRTISKTQSIVIAVPPNQIGKDGNQWPQDAVSHPFLKGTVFEFDGELTIKRFASVAGASESNVPVYVSRGITLPLPQPPRFA